MLNGYIKTIFNTITKVKLMNGKQIVIYEKIIFQTIGTRIDHICTSDKNF